MVVHVETRAEILAALALGAEFGFEPVLLGTGAWINHALLLPVGNLSALPQHVHVLFVDLIDPNVPFGSLGSPGCIAHVGTR